MVCCRQWSSCQLAKRPGIARRSSRARSARLTASRVRARDGARPPQRDRRTTSASRSRRQRGCSESRPRRRVRGAVFESAAAARTESAEKPSRRTQPVARHVSAAQSIRLLRCCTHPAPHSRSQSCSGSLYSGAIHVASRSSRGQGVEDGQRAPARNLMPDYHQRAPYGLLVAPRHRTDRAGDGPCLPGPAIVRPIGSESRAPVPVERNADGADPAADECAEI